MADFSSLTISEVVISPKGAKYAQVTSNGTRPTYSHAGYVRCPFGPSTFDRDETAPRQTLEFRTDPTMFEFFTSLDEWAKTYIANNSETLFKKKMSREQVEERYVSCLKQHPSHDPLLKTKINMPNSATPARIWDQTGVRTSLPTHWKNVEVRPKIQISNLWIMSNQVGLVLQVMDLMVREEQHDCPFATDAMETDAF